MRYVIWGVGKKGKRLFGLLGKDRVEAFVDSNESLIGSTAFDKEIISYDSYKKNMESIL